MAIGWLSVLQWVPWGDVIANAPKLADAARKLWKNTAKNPAAGEPDHVPASKAPTSLASLQVQVDAAEEQVALLHEQMLASSELIKALAEQNTQLVGRIETNRVRMLWIGAVAFIALVGMAACVVVLLQR